MPHGAIIDPGIRRRTPARALARKGVHLVSQYSYRAAGPSARAVAAVLIPARTLRSVCHKCPHCRERLSIAQPDLNRPYRTVGACQECGRWYAIDSEVDPPNVVEIRFPAGWWTSEDKVY